MVLQSGKTLSGVRQKKKKVLMEWLIVGAEGSISKDKENEWQALLISLESTD